MEAVCAVGRACQLRPPAELRVANRAGVAKKVGVRIFQAFRSLLPAVSTRPGVLVGAVMFLLCGLAPGIAVAQEEGGSAARAFLVADEKYGHILAGAHSDDKVQVGSLTKIATAVVVFDWTRLGGHTLDQMVAITPTALAVSNTNPVEYQPGDELSIRDLLYAALVQSDNIAAQALAEHVGKSLPMSEEARGAADTSVVRFVAQMNALARQLGMKRTRFLNPTGIDGKEKPFSTALDLARLTRHALSKAEFRFFIAQKERKITIHRGDQTSSYLLRTTNELLGTHNIDGVKTGQTALAGGCLIISAARDPLVTQEEGGKTGVVTRRLIVVVLGSADRFNEALRQLRRGESLFDAWNAAGRPLDVKTTL